MPDSSLLEVFVASFWTMITPHLWWLAPVAVAVIVLLFPAVGRGPGSSKRDPWRVFKFAARAAVMDRAGGRCEAPLLLSWGRCAAPATEADHVMPWSRGGPTIVSNGQALCRAHNRAKAALVPPWWYVSGLERRRREYAPAGADIRVMAIMSEDDRAARERAGLAGGRSGGRQRARR